MDEQTIGVIITVVVFLAILVVAVYMVYTGKRKVTTVYDALDLFWQAERLVKTYAPAADQLMKIGHLKTNQEKLDYVMDMVLAYLDDFDPKQLRGIIEAWVAENHNRDSNGEPVNG